MISTAHKRDQISFAGIQSKLTDDKILIVDPATREIMEIITKQEAGR